MKTCGKILLVLLSMWIVFLVYIKIYSEYIYKRDYDSYWSLSEKASSIDQKALYLNRYVYALENSGLKGYHNAIVFCTPDNSFDGNMIVLNSFKNRLNSIIGMDPRSFQYNTAISQITGQEQNNAAMTHTFKQIWILKNYPYIWDWVFFINFIVVFCLIIISCGMIIKKTSYNKRRCE